MKVTLFAVFIGLLMVGWGEADLSDPDMIEDTAADAVDWSKLQDRDGVTHLPNSQQPYSGYAMRAYEDEHVEALAQFKDGKQDGFMTAWYENGQKVREINIKDGDKFMSAEVWKPNGEKCPVTSLQDGNGDMVFYNIDGTEKKRRETYKDGDLVK